VPRRPRQNERHAILCDELGVTHVDTRARAPAGRVSLLELAGDERERRTSPCSAWSARCEQTGRVAGCGTKSGERESDDQHRRRRDRADDDQQERAMAGAGGPWTHATAGRHRRPPRAPRAFASAIDSAGVDRTRTRGQPLWGAVLSRPHADTWTQADVSARCPHPSARPHQAVKDTQSPTNAITPRSTKGSRAR
jgi:hypothetical protein